MKAVRTIRYVQQKDLDKKKWDHCIDTAVNSLMYAYSFYLDCIASHWDALILNDYEAVMPLTWRKKHGIFYLYQPAFTQQSGIFCSYPVSEELATEFLNSIPLHFKFAEIFLNYGNDVAGLNIHANFILPLSKDYDTLYSGYKAILKKNLKRAKNQHLEYIKSSDYKKAISSFREQYKGKLPNISREDYSNLEELCFKADEKKQLLVREVYDADKRLSSVALLFKDAKRIYLILLATLTEGRTIQSNHFLLDNLIREYAGRSVILDFEGSDLPGIANFYQNFGSMNQPYYFYRFNHLPWPLNFFKKS